MMRKWIKELLLLKKRYRIMGRLIPTIYFFFLIEILATLLTLQKKPIKTTIYQTIHPY